LKSGTGFVLYETSKQSFLVVCLIVSGSGALFRNNPPFMADNMGIIVSVIKMTKYLDYENIFILHAFRSIQVFLAVIEIQIPPSSPNEWSGLFLCIRP
jgi:hypothetical protein